MSRLYLYSIAAVVGLLAAPAHALLLGLPIDCILGKTCFIQNYVDHQPGEGWKDYRCGHLSYDGHKGTDFRVPSTVEMQAGVNVLAAADGTVAGLRDGMEDINIRDNDPKKIKGKECGNGVMLHHAEGWSTQYCHMKKDSILVKKGDEVMAGDVLGQVGLSGNTEFPHLHLTLREDKTVIDPFTGKSMENACGASGFTKWKPEIEEMLTYHPPGLIGAGFSDTAPDKQSVMEGKHRMGTLPEGTKALLFWVQVYGPRQGDVFRMELVDEATHETVAEHEMTLEKSKADYLLYIGKKTPAPGTYIGHFTLTRETEEGQEALVTYEGHVTVE